jgi:hypothetical protein
MISELVTARHLSRKAYIRQSHPHQVLSKQESLRLQYALAKFEALKVGTVDHIDCTQSTN